MEQTPPTLCEIYRAEQRKSVNLIWLIHLLKTQTLTVREVMDLFDVSQQTSSNWLSTIVEVFGIERGRRKNADTYHIGDLVPVIFQNETEDTDDE